MTVNFEELRKFAAYGDFSLPPYFVRRKTIINDLRAHTKLFGILAGLTKTNPKE